MKVFLIAGEASGDRLGGALMRGLRELAPDVQFMGVGGVEMQGQGMQSLFPMQELSVMGLAEVLPKYFHLKRRIRETAQAVIAAQPDVMVTIDSPDFCLRVAKIVKAESDLRTVHYVAPSVWAWRPGRAAKMARVIDHVLALLPFEPPYMEAAGMGCDFVGHPVVAEPQASDAEVAALRREWGLDGVTVCALPGSRKGEITRLAPVFGAALAQVKPDHIIVPAAPGVEPLVREEVAKWPMPARVVTAKDAPKNAVFAACDVALAASGTVSLELAAAGTPMVIAYDMAWLSRVIMSRMVRIDTVTLVNLVSETRTVPEFIGKNCTPGQIAGGLRDVLNAPDAQRAAMVNTMERLGQGGEAPGLRAARAVLKRH